MLTEISRMKELLIFETCLDNFVKYGSRFKIEKPKPIEPEDLYCTNSIATTIQGVDPDDPEWVEKAAGTFGAVSGDTLEIEPRYLDS